MTEDVHWQELDCHLSPMHRKDCSELIKCPRKSWKICTPRRHTIGQGWWNSRLSFKGVHMYKVWCSCVETWVFRTNLTCHWNEGRQLAKGCEGPHNCHSRKLDSLPRLLKVILPPLRLPPNPPQVGRNPPHSSCVYLCPHLFPLSLLLSRVPSRVHLHPSVFALTERFSEVGRDEKSARGSRLIW